MGRSAEARPALRCLQTARRDSPIPCSTPLNNAVNNKIRFFRQKVNSHCQIKGAFEPSGFERYMPCGARWDDIGVTQSVTPRGGRCAVRRYSYLTMWTL